MFQTDSALTCAEALVALAVQGQVSKRVSRCILQAVHDNKTGHQALSHPNWGRPLRPVRRATRLTPLARERTYLHPLGLLQEELIGEYLEMQVEHGGERLLLRGYYTDSGGDHADEDPNMPGALGWLGVRPSYYLDHERPALLRALSGLTLLNIPEELSAQLMDSHPGSVLLSAVQQTYARREQLASPAGYLNWLLNTGTAPQRQAS